MKLPPLPDLPNGEASSFGSYEVFDAEFVRNYAADYARAAIAAHVPEAIAAVPAQPSAKLTELIAGALYDLMGDLTTRDETLRLGAFELATPACDALDAFAKKRGLSLDNPAVEDWHAGLSADPPMANGLTEAKTRATASVAGLSQPPAPTAQPDLHAACMNLRCSIPGALPLNEHRAYRLGYRDAKYAAAEMIVAQPVQQPGAEPNIIYSPIATKPQADGRHPNDNEPADPDRSHWLTMRGDDEGQGLDPYWKWGHAAGWNDHKKASPAQRQPLPPGLRLAAAFTRADLGPDGSNYPHVRELLAFAEQALGITAAPEAQKGEKL